MSKIISALNKNHTILICSPYTRPSTNLSHGIDCIIHDDPKRESKQLLKTIFMNIMMYSAHDAIPQIFEKAVSCEMLIHPRQR